MDPAKRDKLMDQWEAAKREIADCEVEAWLAESEDDDDGYELAFSQDALLDAECKLRQIEDKFPECRHWASRFAGNNPIYVRAESEECDGQYI